MEIGAPHADLWDHMPLESGEIFINRIDERDAFKQSIESFRRMLHDGNYFDGKSRNILNFHGMGGIGKSKLVERLDDWVSRRLSNDTEWGPRPAVGVDDTAVIDLWNSNGFIEVETLVLAIRNCLNRYKKSWPAFDLALLAYWSAAHPQNSLAEHPAVKESTYKGLKGTLKNILGDLDIPLPSTLGTFGVDLIDQVIRRSREQSKSKKASALHPDFVEFLKECSEKPTPGQPCPEILVRATSLLAQELSQVPGSVAPVNIVFIDTFERLEKDPRREGEKMISELIRRMPNILFVVVGRNKLRWNELTYMSVEDRGPRLWECLNSDRAEEPRPRAIGDLSRTDRRRLVDAVDEKHGLNLDDNIKNLLVEKSAGLPKYLQLALSQAVTLKQNDLGPLAPSNIEGTFPELVKRVLEDIPLEEQKTIRAASMFRVFDPQLVAVAAGAEITTGEHAMRRPMIDAASSDGTEYRMHDAVREALHRSCPRGEQGWVEADWNAAAEKAMHLLRDRYDSCAEADDYMGSLRALASAIELISYHEPELESASSPSYANWLVQAVVYSPSFRGLASMIPLDASTTYGREMTQYIQARAKVFPPEVRIEVLDDLFHSNSDLSIIAGRSLAYEYRSQLRFDNAIRVFDELVQRKPSQLHLYQRCLSKATARRFQDALQSTNGLEEDRIAALRSGVRLWHGDATIFFSRNDAALNKLKAQKRQREYLDSKANRLKWDSLFSKEFDPSEALHLLTQGRDIHHSTAIRDSLVALLLQRPFDSRWHGWFRELLAMDRASNDGRIAYRGSLVRAVSAFCTDDHESLGVLAREIESFDRPRSRTWIPIECIMKSAGHAVSVPETQWVDHPDDVTARWMDAVESLRPHFSRY